MLSDDLTIDILSRLGDARELAKCALVCKEWQELRWAVTRLSFCFKVNTRHKLDDAEGVIFRVLHRRAAKAPGKLRELKVEFDGAYCTSGLISKAPWIGHIVDWGVMLVDMSACDGVGWSPSVWSSVTRLDGLCQMKISGDSNSPVIVGMKESWAFPKLTTCVLRGDAFSTEMFELLLARSPALESAEFLGYVSNDQCRIVGPKLKTLVLHTSARGEWSRRHDSPSQLRIVLDAPELASFRLHTQTSVSIFFGSSQNLTALQLYVTIPCAFENLVPQSLRQFKFSGGVMVREQDCAGLLKSLPMIESFHLKLNMEHKACTGELLAPLINLKEFHTIYYDVLRIQNI